MGDIPLCEIVDVPLAQTGEGIAECELLKWFVQEVGELVSYATNTCFWANFESITLVNFFFLSCPVDFVVVFF